MPVVFIISLSHYFSIQTKTNHISTHNFFKVSPQILPIAVTELWREALSLNGLIMKQFLTEIATRLPGSVQ